MFVDFNHRQGNGTIPLVHLEKGAGKGGRLDMFVVDPETAIKAVRDHQNDSKWYRTMPILAGIQIELLAPGKGNWLYKNAGDMNNAVSELMSPIIQHSYLLVYDLLSAKKNSTPKIDNYYEEVTVLEGYWRDNWCNVRPNFHVYCFAGDKFSGVDIQPTKMK